MVMKLFGGVEVAGKSRKGLVRAIVLLLGVLLLYELGVRFAFVPVLVVLGALWLPLPAIFSSLLSRLVVAGLVITAVLQIAATVQFALLGGYGGFRSVALLAAFTMLLLLARFGAYRRFVCVVDRRDAAAAIVIACFIIPFIPTLAGPRSLQKITTLGSLQAIDGTNHYAGIIEQQDAQHYTHRAGYYYPKGFHNATAFVTHSFVRTVYDFSWEVNARLYIVQYMVMGALLGYITTYLGLACAALYTRDLTTRYEHGVFALALGPVLTLLYLIAFVNEGFLNFYYVCLTIAAGALWLIDYAQHASVKEDKLYHHAPFITALSFFLLVTYGASASWPLVIPALLATALWLLWPATLRQAKQLLKTATWRSALPVALLGALHLLPVYFQLVFSPYDAASEINPLGGLRTFHTALILLLSAGLFWILYRKMQRHQAANITAALLAPLLASVVLILVYQLFTVGEPRYYVIKLSLVYEVLALAVVTGYLAGVLVVGQKLKQQLLFPVLIAAMVVFAVSFNQNPLKDVRDIFRSASGQEKPAFLDADVHHYLTLGTSGLVRHFNMTTLHYNQQQGKFYAHMQGPYWTNMMQYSSTPEDFAALNCSGQLYANLGFGSFSAKEQATLFQTLGRCAAMATDRGVRYYVVTDKDSAPYVKQAAGSGVTVVY